MSRGLSLTPALLLGGWALLSGPLAAAPHKLEALKEAPPAELAAALKEALRPEGWRVLDGKGKPVVDVWLRKEVPLNPSPQSAPGIKFPQLVEGTFLGVVRYHQKHYDFKNKPFPAGTYTFRLAVQPSDGDHLGVSDTRDFGVLSPLGEDGALAPVPAQDLVKRSLRISGTKHPSVLWIKPMSEERKEFPAIVFQEDHEYQVVDLQIPVAGDAQAKPVRMGLVVVGTAPEA